MPCWCIYHGKALSGPFQRRKSRPFSISWSKRWVLALGNWICVKKKSLQPAVKPRSQHLVSGIAFRWHCDLIILPLGNLLFHQFNVSHPYKSTIGKLWNIFFIQHMNQCQQSMPKKNKPLKNITTYQLVTLVFNNVLVSSFIDSLHPILGLHKLPLLRGSTFLAVKVLGDLPWRLAYGISVTMSYM